MIVSKRNLRLFLIPTGIFILLVVYASPDYRGDDQYWYLADVETLLQGGPAVTNNVYPVHVFSDDYPQPVPFVHHTLNLYCVLPAAWLFGVFPGWLITNLIASIITALVIALMVARFTGLWTSLVAYSIYLFLPLTIRQTSQMNAEATITPWVALGVWLYVWAFEKKSYWVILTGVACIAYCCRLVFVPIVLVLPFVYLWHNRPMRRTNLLIAFGMMIISVTTIIMSPTLFPEAVPNSIADTLNTKIPSLTDNMYAYFRLSPIPVTAEHLWHKCSTNLVQQVFPAAWRWQIFYLPFNLTVLLACGLWFRNSSHPQRRLVHCGVVLFGIHLLTVMLTQNTFRYLLISTPALLPAAVILVSRWKVVSASSVTKGLIFTGTILMMSANGLLVHSLRRNAIRESETRETIQTMLYQTIGPQDKVIVEAISNEYLLLGYVLRPRSVLFVQSNYTLSQYQQMQHKTQSQWLLCSQHSEFIPGFTLDSEPVLQDFPAPYHQHALFRLVDPPLQQ